MQLKMNTTLTINTLKKVFTLILIFTLSTSYAQETKEQINNAITDVTLETRGKLSLENAKHRFDYHDVYEKDTQAKFLQSKGFHGGGPSWLGIVYGAFALCESDLIDKIEMNVEVTGITFWSTDKSELDKIGRVIKVIKSNEQILLEVIEIAKEHDMML